MSDSDRLTAEQVREAIFNGSAYASYDGAQYYASGINMQAIADEIEAELGGSVGKSRWAELFGTPERAAEYFAMQCFGSDGGLCYYCPFDDCDEGLRNMGAYPSVRSKMLEWLRGDA